MRSTVRNLALAGVSLLIALVAAELVLRLLFPIPVSSEVEYLPDGHLAFRLQPDRVYRMASGGTCTIDERGFRRESPIEVPKPPGVFRIVALGGSSTFGFDVDDRETWTHRLEEHLSRELGARVEVINAGVPGYNAFDSKINYVYRIRPLEPDAIIVYHTWNDLKRFRLLERYGRFTRAAHPPMRLRKLVRPFQVAQRLRAAYLRYVVQPLREDSYPTGDDFTRPIVRGGAAQRWERQNFVDVVRWIRGDGRLPILVTQPGLLSSESSQDPRIRRLVEVELVGMSHDILLEQWETVSEMIREVAHEEGAVLVDARRAVAATTDHFTDAVHLTARGNLELADAIAGTLLEEARFRVAVASVALGSTASAPR